MKITMTAGDVLCILNAFVAECEKQSPIILEEAIERIIENNPVIVTGRKLFGLVKVKRPITRKDVEGAIQQGMWSSTWGVRKWHRVNQKAESARLIADKLGKLSTNFPVEVCDDDNDIHLALEVMARGWGKLSQRSLSL
tara:strand:+ start:94 stop:510 length:417 start_codon:yes stop_codon:yes gene_type:complete